MKMDVMMKTDIGNGRIMKEFYKVDTNVDIESYANNMIKNYNNTIQSPFDMPRKVLEVKKATVKDRLDDICESFDDRYGQNDIEYTENCWISPYGHVFNVKRACHNTFIDFLLDKEFFENYDYNFMEDSGWVRISQSQIGFTGIVQCLVPMKGKQKLHVEKLMFKFKEEYFGDIKSISATKFDVFELEDGKVTSRRYRE